MDLRYTHAEFLIELKKRGIIVTGYDENYFYVDFSFVNKNGDNYLREPLPENDEANKKFLENTPYRDDGIGLTTIKQCIDAHQKIMAIKVTRALTGWGLKDAKFFIDRVYKI